MRGGVCYDKRMWKRVVPFAYSPDIFSIPDSFWANSGAKVVLSDLDNTLDPYSVKLPSARVKELKNRLEALGIKLRIASNNHSKRVQDYASALGVEADCFLLKPFSRKLKKALRELGVEKSEAILVGDQISTDVIAGNGAGIRTILTEPLSTEEPTCTKINRLFDRPIRKKLRKKGLLKPIQ